MIGQNLLRLLLQCMKTLACSFFSNKPDACEKIHSNLLEGSSNYVLRAYIHDIKLLIYSSEVLPPDSQWIDGENYLWGLFVRSKGKSYPWRSGSTTT